MKVLFIMSHVPIPRCEKRFNLFLKKGYEVDVIFWNRNNEKYSFDNVNLYEIKVETDFKNVVKRLLSTRIFNKKACEIIDNIKPDIIYAFNLDMLNCVYKYGKKKICKIFYEVADLQKRIVDKSKSPIKNILKISLKKIEKKCSKIVDKLVVTSEKYYDTYFNKYYGEDRYIYMPNIPNLSYFENYKKSKHEKFTIGFIGFVRYKEQLKMLLEVSKETNINVLIAGKSFDNEIEDIAKTLDNVEYYGEYNFSKEVCDLYMKVDCIYSVYDASMHNVRVALPNRLYEAIYCELPIIVAKNTYLSEIVEDLNVGEAVDCNSKKELVEVINKLKKEEYYKSKIENCYANKHMINLDFYNNKLSDVIDYVLNN